MKLLSPKYLLMAVVGASIAVGTLPVVHGYDVKVTPTPSTGKPVVTSTPKPSHVEATIEVTSEATELAYENPYADIPFSRTSDGAPVLGDPDAPITIIQFADFACPHCQDYEPTMQAFIQKYVATGRAKYEFRILPTAGGEMTAFVGSMVSCMEDQRAGVFWPLHDAIYAHAEQGEYDAEMLKEVAKQFDLSYVDALMCIGDTSKPLQAETDVQLAQSLSVNGTPGIRVRYKDYNDEAAQFLIVGGKAWSAGGPPLNILRQGIEDAETGNIPDADMTPDAPIISGEPV
jgi:protein-disulfide isomerase